MRQAPLPSAEPIVRGYPVTHPPGTVVPPQPPGWDQLLFAASGFMTVETTAGTWVVPSHRAMWVPDGEQHRIVLTVRTQLRNLYFHPDLVALPTACRAVDVPPLLRELILHAVTTAPLWGDQPADLRLAGVLGDLLVALPVAPLQLPMPVDSRAVAVAESLIADPGSDLSVTALARDAGASRRTIERSFLSDTGMSVGTWRQRLRLLEALRLLAAGESVTRVAAAVGYSTPSARGCRAVGNQGGRRGAGSPDLIRANHWRRRERGQVRGARPGHHRPRKPSARGYPELTRQPFDQALQGLVEIGHRGQAGEA